MFCCSDGCRGLNIVKNLGKASVLVLAVILILSLVLTPAPVTAPTGPPPPIIYVDAPSVVNVSTEFDITIWIRNIPAGWGLTEFVITVSFDPDDIEFIDSDFLDPDGAGGWVGGGVIINPGEWRDDAQSGVLWTEDKAWYLLTFHCLREGPAAITVSSPIEDGTVFLRDLTTGVVAETHPEPVTVTVSQVNPRPVGGVLVPANKLEILAPYLALAGLIAAVSAVVVVRRRLD